MTKTWVIADPHFGHWGVCKFLRPNGEKLRPWDNPNDMNKALIQNWNSVVQDGDRVYLLGDVVINRRELPILYHLKGRKVLVKGNHDIFKMKDYAPFFDDIRAYVVSKQYILSHIPIHPSSIKPNWINIHGHLHSGIVMDGTKPDKRYVCVSVENINYTPVELTELLNNVYKTGSL